MASTPSTQIDAHAAAAPFAPELLQLLEDLPQQKQIELLNFARFLRQQTVATDEQRENGGALHSVAADTLVALTGLVALGGDAVQDVEALYDDI